MNSWTSGYVTDTNYTHGFYMELAPVFLNFVALARNQSSPDPIGKLTYCELGCGQGLTVNILAAANPHIQFYATDFNPAQIANARALALDGGLENAHFYDQSFSEFISEPDLPEKFDIIALHGIYSWISAENRASIIDFLQRKLKVGGLVYISYNALPGWAAAMPLRRLLVDQAATATGSIINRIGAALKTVDHIRTLDPAFFRATPSLAERLDKIQKLDRNYLAHEYFNRDWTPFYFGDVASDLAQAKTTFLASATLLQHIDVVMFTEDQRKLLNETDDVSNKEFLKDIFHNQQFRKDVFVRGALALPVERAREKWLSQRFVLTTPPADIKLQIGSPLGDVTLHENIYKPLIAAFSEGPRLLRDVLKDASIAELGWSAIQQAIIIMVGAGYLYICLPLKDEEKRQKSTRALNQIITTLSKSAGHLQYLASPVTGSGIGVSRFFQLFLQAVREGHKSPDECAIFVWDILSAQGERLMKDGAAIMAPEDNIAELRSQAVVFLETRLSIFRHLKIA